MTVLLAITFVAAVGVTQRDAPSEDPDPVLEGLVQLLLDVEEPEVQLDLLRGLREGLEGRRDVAAPGNWAKAYARLQSTDSPDVREETTLLALLFGEARAEKELRRTLLDPAAPVARRKRALAALVGAKVSGLPVDLRTLLEDPEMRGAALRALAAYDDVETPAAILAVYASLGDAEKADAVSTLASRLTYARALLDAVEGGQLPARDISSVTARQLRAFGDDELSARLQQLWGRVRASSEERKKLVASYKELLTPDVLASADLVNGQRAFQRSCGSCHKMYGIGGDVGPELTGSDRRKLHYVLENVLDPNAVVADAYRMATVVTADGRVVSGIVREKDEHRLMIQTTNERLTIPAGDVLHFELSTVSIMPEGLFRDLKLEEVRDIVAYLASSRQTSVRKPETEGS